MIAKHQLSFLQQHIICQSHFENRITATTYIVYTLFIHFMWCVFLYAGGSELLLLHIYYAYIIYIYLPLL